MEYERNCQLTVKFLQEAERSLRFFRGLGIHEVSDTYRDDMEMMVKISKTNEAEQSGLKSRVEFKDFSRCHLG